MIFDTSEGTYPIIQLLCFVIIRVKPKCKLDFQNLDTVGKLSVREKISTAGQGDR